MLAEFQSLDLSSDYQPLAAYYTLPNRRGYWRRRPEIAIGKYYQHQMR
jgi:hypothetical protein